MTLGCWREERPGTIICNSNYSDSRFQNGKLLTQGGCPACHQTVAELGAMGFMGQRLLDAEEKTVARMEWMRR